MDIVIIIFASILMLVGFLGCFLPVLPGPPLSYVGLLLLQITEGVSFSTNFLLLWAAITIGVQLLDYLVPIYGTKKYGGSKAGVTGSMVGLLLGMFLFPPIGIIIGPMAGALLGELMTGRTRAEAWRSAVGSFLGFLVGTLLKLIASGTMFYYFVKVLVEG